MVSDPVTNTCTTDQTQQGDTHMRDCREFSHTRTQVRHEQALRNKYTYWGLLLRSKFKVASNPATRPSARALAAPLQTCPSCARAASSPHATEPRRPWALPNTHTPSALILSRKTTMLSMLIQQAAATVQRILCMRQPSAVCAAQPRLSLHDTLARFFLLAAGLRCHLWPCTEQLAQCGCGN